MVRMVISSPLFLNRNPMTKATLSSLHVRGLGVQVDDALARKGWEGEEAVLSAVITSDPASGNIKGSRYETRGPPPTWYSSRPMIYGA